MLHKLHWGASTLCAAGCVFLSQSPNITHLNGHYLPFWPLTKMSTNPDHDIPGSLAFQESLQLCGQCPRGACIESSSIENANTKPVATITWKDRTSIRTVRQLRRGCPGIRKDTKFAGPIQASLARRPRGAIRLGNLDIWKEVKCIRAIKKELGNVQVYPLQLLPWSWSSGLQSRITFVGIFWSRLKLRLINEA